MNVPPPQPPYDPLAPGPPTSASRQLEGPAVAILVTAGLDVMSALANIVMRIFGIGMSGLESLGGLGGQSELFFKVFSGTIGIVGAFMTMALAGVRVAGALKMRALENYNLAMASAVLTLLPCTTCCCWGIPVGAWALTVITKPEIKAEFRS